MSEKMHKQSLYERMSSIERLTAVRTVRGGLLNITPVLIVGAFALILKSFPVTPYQHFIANFSGGLLFSFFDFIYAATFGVLSVYMTVSISRSYVRERSTRSGSNIGAILTALLCFFILSGAYLPTFTADNLGPKSMFLAILTGLGASAIYRKLDLVLPFRKRRYYSTGADREFNQMLARLAPLALTALLFAAVNAIIVYGFHMESFRDLLVLAFDKLFSIVPSGFLKGFFFVLLSSLLWFFGIHGSDTLESVMQTNFFPNLAANQSAIAAGGAPQEMLTKPFFDCFVLMGGCGTALCLLIAILLFSKNKARRGLGVAAAFPMFFNINELMVFGLPIIFNPLMLIPFILTPLVCYSVSYLALSLGLVPLITGSVEWTTPIILGGYQATGSVAGSILQIANVILGVLIYLPFIRRMDRNDEEKYRAEYDSFVDFFRQNEQSMPQMQLTERKDAYGDFAKALCAELKAGLQKELVLAYQPQYDYTGTCVGAEALLRWKHPTYGVLYPPIIIKLAKEGDFLPDLEEAVLQKALTDRPALLRRFGQGIKLSVNVTGKTVVTPRYLQFCGRLSDKGAIRGNNICLEVTEQDALAFDEATKTALRTLREAGFTLAIDDFSMGQTSLNYLKENLFDYIKLDGSLVRGLFAHNNCKEIIESITRLAQSLSLTVIAEFVETPEQRDALHAIGCDTYQGYLYSPAVFLDAPSQK